jgi:hypothetical protein
MLPRAIHAPPPDCRAVRSFRDGHRRGRARARGDTFTFLTSDRALYEEHAGARAALAHADRVIEVASFAPGAVDERIHEAHRKRPFDAVLCLHQLRVAEAARLAHGLGRR